MTLTVLFFIGPMYIACRGNVHLPCWITLQAKCMHQSHAVLEFSILLITKSANLWKNNFRTVIIWINVQFAFHSTNVGQLLSLLFWILHFQKTVEMVCSSFLMLFESGKGKINEIYYASLWYVNVLQTHKTKIRKKWKEGRGMLLWQ